MPAIYNDNDPFAADWLQELIAHGHLPPGTVDRRSIADLTPADVAGSGQRHFFAGIGGWPLALRLAGVPDDADIWTGSCPCQGLSDAGQRRGFLDPRHLWPAWLPLIRECRPTVIFGEQVASTLGLQWLDLVSDDLERCGYAVGAADLCAAGVGAPHARQRLFFVAYADSEQGRLHVRSWRSQRSAAEAGRSGQDGGMADAAGERRDGQPGHVPSRSEQFDADRRDQAGSVGDARCARWPERSLCDPRNDVPRGRHQATGDDQPASAVGSVANRARQRRREGREAKGQDGSGSADHRSHRELADANSSGLEVQRQQQARRQLATVERGGTSGDMGDTRRTRGRRDARSVPGSEASRARGWDGHRRVLDQPVPAGSTRGYWADADWILCRDPAGGPPVARPVEPGTFPLATGVPGRVGLLRGYGNSIVPQVAAEFVMAFLDAISPSA